MSKFMNCGKHCLSPDFLLCALVMLMPCQAFATSPTVATNTATSINATGATLNGTVNPQNHSTTVTFNYGLTTGYGSVATASQSPLASGSGSTAVSAVVSGLTCNTTYHFQAVGQNSSGTNNGADASFTTSACPFSCTQPSNTPIDPATNQPLVLTCQCDTFQRTTLNPSTIFAGSNWVTSTSSGTFGIPKIVNPGYLRLTDNSGNDATAASVPGIFPAAGNYISVEFQSYSYNGTGADGIAMILSDYAVPAVPGGFGGSLGYAQKGAPPVSDCTLAAGCPGFAGGWLGTALDDYGNYSAATEGRVLGPGADPQSVGLRGPGSGQNGYRWEGGALGIGNISNNSSTTPAPGNMYQVIVDARNSSTGSILLYVNRDTTTQNGANYTNIFGGTSGFNAYTEANYAFGQGWTSAVIPNNWQISFTGSTGGSYNIHEIGSLRICAQVFVPVNGGTAGGFNAIDSAYGTPPAVAVQNYLSGHIYTKLVGTPFNLNVAALANSQIVTTYAYTAAKTVTVKLVDNSDSLTNSSLDCTVSCTSTCLSKPAIAGGTQTLTFAAGSPDQGQKATPNFTINTAYQKLVAIISDNTTPTPTTACSTDAFSVRPLSIASVTSSNATNAGTSGAPTFSAGSGNFALSATTTGVSGSTSGYTGVLKINNSLVTAASPATVNGILAGTFPAAVSGTGQSTVNLTPPIQSTFTYSEAGGFTLPVDSVYEGVVSTVDCVSMTTAACDTVKAATWTGVDSISTKSDCIANSFSNTLSAGQYGCNFGNVTAAGPFGRFVPDHFDTVVSLVGGVPMVCPTGVTCPVLYNGFVYSGPAVGQPGQPFTLNVYARNAAGATTQNYSNATGLSKAVTLSAWSAPGSSTAASGTVNGSSVAASAFSSGATVSPGTPATPNFTFATIPTAPTNIYIRAVDTDAVTSLRGASSVEGGTAVVSGRVNVTNAYGAETLPLTLTAAVQYWTGNGYVTSTTDNVDTLTAGNVTRSLGTCAPGYLLASGVCSTTLGTISSITSVSADVYSIKLGAPGAGNSGSENLNINAGGWPAWLPSVPGRATFGMYKGSNQFIYLREAY